jgi:chitodextrinase
MKKLLLIFSLALIMGINSVKSQVQEQQTVFPSQSVHSIDGVGWANNMGTNFITGSHFWVYINPNLEAVVAKKSSDGTITTKVLVQNVQNNDNHAEFSLGVDNDGYIHIIGGQHNSSPQYYVSTNPDDISSFQFKGNDLATGGLQGTEITYQSFTRSNKGTLFVNYRSNVVGGFVTGARAIALGRYDTKTKRWTMLGGKNYQVVTTTSCTPTTGDQTGITAFVWNNSGVGDMRPADGKCYSHAHYQGYQLKIKFDQNNRMHVTYNMADSINSTSDVSKSMTHLFYAYSPDEGNTWYKANGNQITNLPITKAKGDLVHKRIPSGYVYPATTSTATMPNSSSLILDKDGLPIVVQFDNIANSNLMFKWSGTSWVNQTSLTNRSDRFYTDLSKKIIYNFGSSKQFQMSYDNMATFTNNVTMTKPATWYVVVDDYYLIKTRNVMYYARDETAGQATIMNMVVSSPDASAPVAPSGLFSSDVADNSITLNWNPSTELDVARYDVFRNGTLVGSTGSTYYTISGLSAGTSYTFTVKAADGSKNVSPSSLGLTVSTTGTSTSGGLIVYEPYKYTVGTTSNDPDAGINGGAGLPATNTGGNPTGTGTGLRNIYGAEAKVVSGLTYSNLYTSGGAHQITNATWGTTTIYPYRYMTTDPFLSKRVAADGNFGVDGQSLYISFIVRTSSSTAGAFCFVIGGSRNVYIENTATGWSINDNKSGSVPTTATLQLNTATLLVVKIDFKAGAADVVSLYKNPTIGGTLGSPVASLTVGADFTINNFNTRPNVANAMTIDEFRMGLSYAVVTPTTAPTTLATAKFDGLLKISSEETSVSVYPNPASTSFNVSAPGDNAKITISALDGKVIATVNAKSKVTTIDSGNWEAGVYLIQIQTGAQTTVKKVIISK